MCTVYESSFISMNPKDANIESVMNQCYALVELVSFACPVLYICTHHVSTIEQSMQTMKYRNVLEACNHTFQCLLRLYTAVENLILFKLYLNVLRSVLRYC